MESKDELKEIDNYNCTLYYYDRIMTVWDIYSKHILLRRKSI